MKPAMTHSAALELIEERTFSARLNGHTVTGLQVAGTWEGLTKFHHPASSLHLIVRDSDKRLVDGSPTLMFALGLTEGGNEHFVLVPETLLPNGTLVPAFLYARYPASKGDDGKLQLSPSAKPWVNVSYREAVAACADAGYQLARETQELAIRLNVVNQPGNWTGGAVGAGQVYQGLHLGKVSSAQAADFVSPEADERSWHVLSTGERVYGLAGNIHTWVFDDVQGDADGIVARRFDERSLSLVTPPYGSRQCGMGWRPDADANWSGRALVRGGYWNDGDYAGVFSLLSGSPDIRSGDVGFRCTK
ncbi:hypothetical protein GJ700_12515 [Duganella sp. FT92W]|uniref:SUMF1/EgtB/PvdO family nonheme iron enzyme n=1 Tax=Pseudoduganella rivuli TaxID=2666085 RepID=A0A7X2IN57_9BURK|nr:hypothetical protein [Pseudoduganella rivuli]MRV72533.1 hypothetical protein [Pseudoduganella rivuli]